MSTLSLQNTETLHLAIGRAALALGLEARYMGAMAIVSSRGLRPAVQEGVWSVALPAPQSDDQADDLQQAGVPLFTLTLRNKGGRAARIELPFTDGDRTLVATSARRGRSVDAILKPHGLSFAAFTSHLLGNLN